LPDVSNTSPFAQRDLHAAGSPYVPADFLQSLFVAEVIHPSRRLWISSPWLSDVELIDNTARQFASVCPDWPAARIRLSTILGTLLDRGAEVVLVVNEATHNDELLARLEPMHLIYGGRLQVIRDANMHEKGILGDDYTLNGSMNLTYGGVNLNEELLIYRTDPEAVAERRLSLEHVWGHRL
jgi:phosphatidylserine/phosphatidylglycerophosphate/cardiolipin synthase-like enzyme